MSTPGPPPSPGFRPGDRVRLRYGMFKGLIGEVVWPHPNRAEDSLVRLPIWGRDVEAPVANWMLEPVRPDEERDPT
jgi:transcription antitermination factor NusG